MAQIVQYKHGNAVIPFDSGKSYVVCNLPERQEDYKIHDKLGRSAEEVKFLDAFERIFYAAARGDLKKCQTIVEEEKFPDIDAYSINKFANQSNGQSLDYVSVRKVAEMNKHTHITEYFAKRFGGSPAQPAEKKAPMVVMTSENQRTYDFHLKTYKDLSHLDNIFPNVTRSKIMATYSIEEQIENASLFKRMNIEQLFEVLSLRCGKEFSSSTPYDTEKRVELYALRDCIAEKYQFKKIEASKTADSSQSKTAACVFFGPDCDPELAYLDNGYSTTFEFGGRNYSSAAVAYAAQKVSHRPDLMDQLATMNIEEIDKFEREHYSAFDENLENWFPKRREHMLNILRSKFGQNSSIKEKLLLTDDVCLCFCPSSKREDVFAINGLPYSNLLGHYLMEVRKEYGGFGKVDEPKNLEELMKSLKIQ